MKRFTSSLHTHVESIFDAHIPAKALTGRIKQLGGTSCAITDHGVLSAIEDYRRVFKEDGLKFIPGCELYVDGGVLGRLHLIVLAKDYQGYLGISKMVTKANETITNSFPVISQEDVFRIAKDPRYKNHIISLSACMQGIICSIFLQNDILLKKIAKAENSRDKYTDPNGKEMKLAEQNLSEAEQKYAEVIALRDRTKETADRKFSAREKAVAKLKKQNEDVSYLEAEIIADKTAALKAAEDLKAINETLRSAKSAVSSAKKEIKFLMESSERWLAKDREVRELKAELKKEEDLEKIAETVALEYSENFGPGNFYVELQYHGIESEAICFPKALAVAKKMNLPIVATNDVHVLTRSENDLFVRKMLRSMRFGQLEETSEADKELYLKDNEELLTALKRIIPEEDAVTAINNIEVIASRCNVEWPEKPAHYPKFSKTEDTNIIFDKALAEGVKNRFPNGLTPEYQARLDYEVSVIKKMGYVDYHLVVKDFLEYGRLLGFVPVSEIPKAPLTIEELREYINKNNRKNPGMTIGNGRGSAAGSLVCYCLGITSLDPIKYGLLFERFLNVERVSMPDIDSDLANNIREKTIDYVRHKYGNNAVCGIMTKTYQAPKGAIAIACKFYALEKGLTVGDGMRWRTELSGDIPFGPKVKFNTPVNEKGEADENGSMSLLSYMFDKHKGDEDLSECIRRASLLEGTFTAYGAHAAGIVISDNDDVSDYIPLRFNDSLNALTTQCDMVQVEDSGLLKFDFLGLKTLDIITDAMRSIEKNHGIIIKPLELDITDKNIYSMLASGKTKAVFQFESPGMTSVLKKFKPTCFEDLIIIVSMFRPGPLQFIDDVVAVKNHTKEMTFLCPELKPILGKTYGAIVYQEQVMEIFQKLAGYSLGGADMVRRAMSKKKTEKLAHEREAFINGDAERNIKGCVANGICAKAANELFDRMMAFASYAFNKSHAACYAYNSYITAWLKYYYPAEYITAALNWASDSSEVAALMYEATKLGITVLPPDVNKSQKEFSCDNDEIRFGLSAVAGVKNRADEIIKQRGNGVFKDLLDFYARVLPASNVSENLIDAGACDALLDGLNRASAKKYIEDISTSVDTLNKKNSLIRSCNALLPVIESFTDSEQVKAFQISKGLKPEIKEITSASSLETKMKNAENAANLVTKDLKALKPVFVKENPLTRMAAEKELLGVYVTAHPMDCFPSHKEVHATPISEITNETTSVYGIITDIKEKDRKKDGKPMALFKLEDKSGSVDVCVFTKAYSEYAHLLKNGRIVRITGSVKAEQSDEGTSLTFFAEKISLVKETLPSCVLTVSSYGVFHAVEETDFINRYASETGIDFYIYDKAMQEIRKMLYRVSENVLSLPNASKMEISQ